MHITSTSLYEIPETPLQTTDLSIALNMDLIVLVRALRSLHGGSLLGRIDLLVEPDQDLPEPETTSDSHTEHGNDNSVGLSVAVLGHLPNVGTGDVAELGESVDEGDSNGSLRRRPGKR